uniref:Peptidase C14 caspase domain-containing protein n=1 Tax=viral metagenome TaxID=1070528 RepID=A0A6C0J7R5_9ZZZZ
MDIPTEYKYALLVGINYTGTSSALKGCETDVDRQKEYLIKKRGYRSENIVILTEDTDKKATGMNIMHALGKLIIKSHVAGAKELWFHYSGHGSNTCDLDHDEKDGRDETIVPMDYLTNGMITDDQLHDYAESIPIGCRMIFLFDCCHSGTILDLKWRYEGAVKNYIENAASSVKSNVFMLSGCQDNQTSADALIQGKWAGAMTTAFIECIDKSVTWENVLDNMRAYMKKNGYSQRPRLCCSNPITDKDKVPK